MTAALIPIDAVTTPARSTSSSSSTAIPSSTIACSAASRVVGDHCAVLREVRDLMTDHPRVDEVPGREENNDSVASPVAIPSDPAAVFALDESLVARNRPRDQHGGPSSAGVRLIN